MLCNTILLIFFLAVHDVPHSALHLAILEGWGVVVEYFIDMKADVHLCNAVGRTPLHIAATVGRSDIGAHLLRMKASPGVMDSLGWTARQAAEFHHYSDFCEMMIRAEMVDKQYSMKDVPPGKWDTTLWKEVVGSYHDKKEQLDKETRRFDKKIHRMSSAGSLLTVSRQSSTDFTLEGSDTSVTGSDSVASESFDALARKKKAKEGVSTLAMAARRQVMFK